MGKIRNKLLDRRYESIQCWVKISAAKYYCPFALIYGLIRVSVRVCSITVDPMGPRGVTDKMVSEPTLYRSYGKNHSYVVSL